MKAKRSAFISTRDKQNIYDSVLRYQIWQTMRLLQKSGNAFTIPNIATAVTTGTTSDICIYIYDLYRHGYVKPQGREGAGGHKHDDHYQLVRDTGPFPPEVRKDGKLFDTNTRQLIDQPPDLADNGVDDFFARNRVPPPRRIKLQLIDELTLHRFVIIYMNTHNFTTVGRSGKMGEQIFTRYFRKCLTGHGLCFYIILYGNEEIGLVKFKDWYLIEIAFTARYRCLLQFILSHLDGLILRANSKVSTDHVFAHVSDSDLLLFLDARWRLVGEATHSLPRFGPINPLERFYGHHLMVLGTGASSDPET